MQCVKSKSAVVYMQLNPSILFRFVVEVVLAIAAQGCSSMPSDDSQFLCVQGRRHEYRQFS